MSRQPPIYDAHTLATAGDDAGDDAVRWLALLIREGLMVIVSGIERRLGLRRRVDTRFECPRCKWRG